MGGREGRDVDAVQLAKVGHRCRRRCYGCGCCVLVPPLMARPPLLVLVLEPCRYGPLPLVFAALLSPTALPVATALPPPRCCVAAGC